MSNLNTNMSAEYKVKDPDGNVFESPKGMGQVRLAPTEKNDGSGARA